ncbi:MAG: hypothetical protein E7612_10860 [Ruminococcaceae bacterium]|nr:hypothetical protein [Oscillospiraceae bacterium]
MDDFNTYEYGAEQKAEGKWKLLKIVVLLGYILLVSAYFIFLYIIRIIPLFAITPIWLWILCHFTWRYTKPDYRYFIEKGTFTFFVFYGKKNKSEKTKFTVSSAEAIAPKAELEDKIREFSPARVYSAVPSVKARDVYAALYTDSHGKKCVIYFVATASALKLLRFYNSRTVVTETVA